MTDAAALTRALHVAGEQRPIVLSSRAFSDLSLQLLREGQPMPPAIRTPPGWTVLLPGPLGACADDAVRAGAHSVGGGYEGAP